MAAGPQHLAERALLSAGPSRQSSCPRHAHAHHGAHTCLCTCVHASTHLQALKYTCTYPHRQLHAQTQACMLACVLTPTSTSTVNVPTRAPACTHAHAHVPPPACTPLEAGSQLSPKLHFVPRYFSPPTGAQGFYCTCGPVSPSNNWDGVEDIGPLGLLPAGHRAGGPEQHVPLSSWVVLGPSWGPSPAGPCPHQQPTGSAGTEAACLGGHMGGGGLHSMQVKPFSRPRLGCRWSHPGEMLSRGSC